VVLGPSNSNTTQARTRFRFTGSIACTRKRQMEDEKKRRTLESCGAIGENKWEEKISAIVDFALLNLLLHTTHRHRG
jgi:hypothetical protein